MQKSSPDPALKAELARCFAAHQALKSLQADVRITVLGAPQLRNTRFTLALERPGRLRIEGLGALRPAGIEQMVASHGFLYEAFAPRRVYKTTSVPVEGDALVRGLEENGFFPLPIFSQLLTQKDGLESLLEEYDTVTMEREALIGAAPLRVFVFKQKEGRRYTLRFGERDGLLRQAHLQIEKPRLVEIREDYTNLRVNPSLPERLWEFVPPRGYRDEEAPFPALPPAPKLGKGTVTTSSGLQYLDRTVGKGALAQQGTKVRVHYTGRLTDGSVFDSSLSRAPFELTLPGPVIPGWNEGLLGMRVGGKRVLVIPPKLGYGDAGAGGVIPPNATLIFEVELLSVEQGPRG